MEKDYFRYYKPKLLVSTIIVLSIIYGYLLHYFTDFANSILAKPYVHFPTVSALIISTLLIFDKYALKIPFLKKLLWVKDLSGRYEGTITYKHFQTGNIEQKHCFVEIEQTTSKISVKTYFDFKYRKETEKTISKSLVTSIVPDDGFNNQKLVFTYQNDGNTLKGLQPSHGTNILQIIERDNELFLEGIYYTNKEPQTKGEMKVKLISKKLKKEF